MQVVLKQLLEEKRDWKWKKQFWNSTEIEIYTKQKRTNWKDKGLINKYSQQSQLTCRRQEQKSSKSSLATSFLFFLQPVIMRQNFSPDYIWSKGPSYPDQDITSRGNNYCYEQVLQGKEPTPARCCSRLISQSFWWSCHNLPYHLFMCSWVNSLPK